MIAEYEGDSPSAGKGTVPVFPVSKGERVLFYCVPLNGRERLCA